MATERRFRAGQTRSVACRSIEDRGIDRRPAPRDFNFGHKRAQAGEAKLREVITAGGFATVRCATETPFNMILEARP